MHTHRHNHEGHRHAHGDFGRGRHGGGRAFSRDGGHRGEGRRGGGGRRERVFDHGDLRFVILQLIAEKPRHGYELIKAIEDKLAGAYSPSPGVIYPTLTMLEELGYAAVSESVGKKLYAITDAGTEVLAKNKAVVDAIFARMAETGSAHGGNRDKDILVARKNLKHALHTRLSQGPLNEEQVKAIAAALNAAAEAIERS
jgi:DNA-binding PadR family transcriptional regulator